MLRSVVVAALGLAPLVSAHVTLNPNFGASAGGYFKFHVKIPHGTADYETTKIVIDIPEGVQSVKPEAMHGWDIDITSRKLNRPYTSHGNLRDMAPGQITYTAKCTGAEAPTKCDNDDHPGLHNDHLLELALQVKIGCDFGVNAAGAATADATMWKGQHTIWFPVMQFLSTAGTNDGNKNENEEMLSWTGTAKGDESWGGAKPRPSPYLFIYSSSKCNPPDSTGEATAGDFGMRWGLPAVIVPPVADQDPVKTKAEVIALITESQLDLEEELALTADSQLALTEEKLGFMTDSRHHLQEMLQLQIDATNDHIDTVAVYGVVAIVLSAVLMAIMMVLLFCRVIMPRTFNRALLPEDRLLTKEREVAMDGLSP